MKSVWRGHIRFSLVNIPVQIFNAVENSNYIRFNQLHKEDGGRIRYKKICSVCDTEVKSKDIVKGYEYADNQYVSLSKEEFKQIKLKSTRTIEIEGFIALGEVHPSRFEAVYFVGPHEEQAIKTYHLFARSLRETGKAAVGRIVLRDKEDVVLLQAHEDGVIMYKLRYPYEIRDFKDVPDVKSMEIDDAQLDLAKTLISSMSTSFEEIPFEDHYQLAVKSLLDKKIEGKEWVQTAEPDEVLPQGDIMETLRASIEAAKKQKK